MITLGKKIGTLELAATGSTKTLLQGSIKIPKGKEMIALVCKATFPVANATGGALASGLSDARKQNLFADYLWNLSYGDGKQFKPFIAQDTRRLHREFRYAIGSELELYSDTTSGLAKAMPDAATTNADCWLGIPTGYFWQLGKKRRSMGVGRTQALTVELDVTRTDSTIDTNITVSGTVTLVFYPLLRSCKGDRWNHIPHYREYDRTEDEVELPEGLPLRISERTAVHASSTLSKVSLWIDGEEVHQQISAADLITPFNDQPRAPSASAITDRETLLYWIEEDASLEDMPTGKPKVRQDTKDLATIKLGYLYIPVKLDQDVAEQLEYVVQEHRRKELRAVKSDVFDGLPVPVRLKPYMPSVFVDRQDREFEEFPGPVASPGKKAEYTIPESLLQRAKSAYADKKAKGENKAADEVVRQIISAVPGAVRDARGSMNGNIFSRYASMFG